MKGLCFLAHVVLSYVKWVGVGASTLPRVSKSWFPASSLWELREGSQAALDTLAVVAYRQPCTRAQVAAVRGVNVDSVMRNLAARGLIEECGQTNLGALLYRTTTAFLEQSGLSSLDDLRPLAPYMAENPDLSAVLATDLNEILDSESADSEIKGTPLDASDSEERETHE